MSALTAALLAAIFLLLAYHVWDYHLKRGAVLRTPAVRRAPSRRALGDAGGPCADGSVCSGGLCVPCGTTDPCPAGLLCVGGKCSLCGPGTPCPGGAVCTNGLCGPCDPTHPCPSGQICTAGVCSPCDPAHPCPGGQVCTAGTCSPCDPAHPCPGGQVCTAGACGPCDATHPCPAGLTCVGGVCGPCDPTHPCPSGQVCVGGACVPACVPCDNDLNACPSGQVCVLGSCVAAPKCGPNSPCPGGLTCGTDGVCAACYTWRTWNIAKDLETPPSDIYGDPSSSLPTAYYTDSPAMRSMGYLARDGSYVAVFPGGDGPPQTVDRVSYLSVPKGCPAPATAKDPNAALQFHGEPVCVDRAKRSMFVPYANGACVARTGYAPTLLGVPM
jgi:hypothetical protein